MRGSYYDKWSVSAQLEIAGLDARHSEFVANAIRNSRDPSMIRAEMNTALLKVDEGILGVNVLLTAVLIKVL